LGTVTLESEIVFVIFLDDGVWKLYRDGELLAPYSEKQLAEEAAHRFAAEITKVGKTATIQIEER